MVSLSVQRQLVPIVIIHRMSLLYAVEDLSNTHSLICYMTANYFFTANTGHEFPCLEEHSTNETPTELQFCDGSLDCTDGSDELTNCPSGN